MKLLTASLISSLFATLPLFAEKPDPKSLEFTKWTPDFQIPNPVAISFDEQGRAYVSQTQRRKANDLDIRNNRDWVSNDLSFKTPDEKRAFYHKIFTPENSDANKKRVKEYNKDGKHDLKDLQALTDRVSLIEDTDGNGFADKTSIYAEGFNSEITGIAAGVLHHDGDVYVTAIPDLWKLRDTTHDGKADTRESLAYGFGPHIALGGHDMHGLTVGPDGRIYWTVGDKGVGVTSKEGLKFKYPNQGALLRCEPDGSNFEVYARGLRNVQEIAFDQYGNIFGVDNDSDSRGEKERFVYIVRHMDAGWRCNWQYRKGGYNPWMDENLHVPYQKDQPVYITPPISLYNNGPAGMAFNPGTALGEEWNDYFFHTSAPNGQQWAFQVEEDGASFKMVNDMQIGNGVPIVGINFGPDGALYGVDWGGGYPLNEKGAVWKWDVKNKNPLREATANLLRADFSKIEIAQLVEKLDHLDQRIRLKSQFELAKRGSRKELKEASLNSTQIGRIHAIWGLGQIYRTTKEITPELSDLLTDQDPEIRVQAVKTLGDLHGTHLALHRAPAPKGIVSLSEQEFIPLLKDPSDRVKFHAAIAIGNVSESEGAQAILGMIRSTNDDSKTFLRHAAVVGLTGCATSEFLVNLSKDDSELIQKIAVVALRRRANPAVAEFLKSPMENVAAEAARAIHDDWMIEKAMPALASSLTDTKWLKNESLIRRAINANFHLGTLEHANRVASYAAQTEIPEQLRLDALDALGKWTNPEDLDRIVGRYRLREDRNPQISKAAISPQLTKLLTDPSQKIQSKAMGLARSQKIKMSAETLLAVSSNETSLTELRIEALRTLASQKHPDLKAILTTTMKAKSDDLRIIALKLLAETDSEAALEFTQHLLHQKNGSTREKQASLDLLSQDLASKNGDKILQALIDSFDQIPVELQLNLAEAAALRNLKAPSPDFSQALIGGDDARGKHLFMNHLAAQCVRCHKVADGKGSDLGPNLKSIGLIDRNLLLESIMAPQKVIADGYGSISLTLKNGKSVVGLFQSEKNGIIKIRDSEGALTKVKLNEIKERSPVISTMPPMGLILTNREIRDLIEYLSTLKEKPKK